MSLLCIAHHRGPRLHRTPKVSFGRLWARQRRATPFRRPRAAPAAAWRRSCSPITTRGELVPRTTSAAASCLCRARQSRNEKTKGRQRTRSVWTAGRFLPFTRRTTTIMFDKHQYRAEVAPDTSEKDARKRKCAAENATTHRSTKRPLPITLQAD
jgi:hypothetical protein